MDYGGGRLEATLKSDAGGRRVLRVTLTIWRGRLQLEPDPHFESIVETFGCLGIACNNHDLAMTAAMLHHDSHWQQAASALPRFLVHKK